MLHGEVDILEGGKYFIGITSPVEEGG